MVHWSTLSGHNVAQVNDGVSTTYNGGFRSGAVNAVASFDFQFNSAGTYFYVCEAHASSGMRGVIFVLPPASPFATPTHTATLGPALQATSGVGPPSILALSAYPNPLPGQGLLLLQLAGDAESLRWEVFSQGYSQVMGDSAQNAGPGWSRLALDLKNLANGVYYLRVTVEGKGSKDSKVMKIYISK
jgi:hypothetical protein